jgi:hypothetical protein
LKMARPNPLATKASTGTVFRPALEPVAPRNRNLVERPDATFRYGRATLLVMVNILTG